MQFSVETVITVVVVTTTVIITINYYHDSHYKAIIKKVEGSVGLEGLSL